MPASSALDVGGSSDCSTRRRTAISDVAHAAFKPQVFFAVIATSCRLNDMLDFKNLQNIRLQCKAIPAAISRSFADASRWQAGILSQSWSKLRSQPSAHGFGYALRLAQKIDFVPSHQGSRFPLGYLPSLSLLQQHAQPMVSLGFHSQSG